MSVRAALCGLALAFTPGFNIANVGAVADRTAHAYGIGLAAVGLFTTALFLTHAIFQVPAGRLCDRFGARIVGGTGLAVVALASASALVWRVAAFAIGMRLVAGVGTALSFVAGTDYVRSTIGTPVGQGAYGAVSVTAGGLALALVPLWSSWRAPFAAASLVAAVGVCSSRLHREGPACRDARRDPGLRPSLAAAAIWHSASFGLRWWPATGSSRCSTAPAACPST